MNHDILYLIGDALVAVIAVAIIAFLFIYHLLARWEESPEGRNVMFFMAALLGVILLVVFSVIFGPDYPLRAIARVVVYSTLAVLIITRARLVIQSQKRVRLRDQDQAEEISK